MQRTITKEQLSHTKQDYELIRPNVRQWDVFELKNDPEIIRRGELATKKLVLKR